MRLLILFTVIVVVAILQYQNCGPVPQPFSSTDLMQKTQTRIQEIVANDYCQNDAECKILAFGSKPCGGPHSFIVHSATANWDELENLVTQYNQYELEVNRSENLVGTCELTAEPTNLRCINNKCLAQ